MDTGGFTWLIWLFRLLSWAKSLWCFITLREALFFRHSSLHTYKVLAKAKNRIVLHAAFYPTYASTADYSSALRAALAKPSFGKLEVFLLSLNPIATWIPEFVRILRWNYSVDDFRSELTASRIFFQRLRDDYPDKVVLYETQLLPCFPLVIIDNIIYVGHYAHSKEPAPNGYWLKIKADVDKLVQWVDYPSLPIKPTNRSVAAYRFVAEYVNAKGNSSKI